MSGYRTELAQILYLLENGLTLDQVRVLHFGRSDVEFAMSLQYLRDNGIDVDSLDKVQTIELDVAGTKLALAFEVISK